MGLRSDLKKRALGVSQKAVERLFQDEKRAMKIAQAIGKVQQTKQALDKGQEDLMRALSLAPKGDFKQLGKQLSGLKRRLRELDEKLAGLSR
ncbi:MAG: hypothetical protein ACJ790_16625 [Myxococcaceae bacterium]